MVSLPPPEVVLAVAIAALAGATLLCSLVAANRLLRVIARRLASLDQGLDAISAATAPLTERIAAVGLSAANLRDAATRFNLVLARRVDPDPHRRAEAGTP